LLVIRYSVFVVSYSFSLFPFPFFPATGGIQFFTSFLFASPYIPRFDNMGGDINDDDAANVLDIVQLVNLSSGNN